MNKKEFIKKVSERAETTQILAERVSDAVFETIMADVFMKYDKFHVMNFGSFESTYVASRTYSSFDGEKGTTNPKRKFKFTPAPFAKKIAKEMPAEKE